jgi:predicted outer membrane protein
VAGTFVWLGGRAVAQQTTPLPDTSTQQSQTGTATISSDAKKFLTKTAQDSILELESSELALQRAQSKQVADVALRLYNDHAQFNRALLELGRQYNISLPVDISSNDRSKLEKLSRQKGAAFDQYYIQELAKANAKSISEFQDAASKVQNPDVQAFIKSFLPAQQEHLQLAQSANSGSSSMSGTSGSSGMTGNGGSSGTTGTSGSSGMTGNGGSSGTTGTPGQ